MGIREKERGVNIHDNRMKLERENMSPIRKSIGRSIHFLAEFMEIHVIKQDIEAACKRMKNDWESCGITLMGNMKSASKRLWVERMHAA